MGAEVAALTRYRVKGGPGEALSEMRLLDGLGAEGDFHRGGDRQVSIISTETRRLMDAQTEPGFCFRRFRENILIEGLPEDTDTGSLLTIGEAVLRITERGRCHNDCPRFVKNGTYCGFAGRTLFAAVKRGGMICLGEAVFID